MSVAYLDQVLSVLEFVHEGVSLDADVRVEHVEPLGQVFFHGVEVLVGPREGQEVTTDGPSSSDHLSFMEQLRNTSSPVHSFHCLKVV